MRLFNFRGDGRHYQHDDELMDNEEFWDESDEEAGDDMYDMEEMDQMNEELRGRHLRHERDGDRWADSDRVREEDDGIRGERDCRHGGHHHHGDKRVCFTVPKGEQGDRGERGARGERGERGERGHRGERGENGANGARGERGERGERGHRGEAGPRGERGERGHRGERGESIRGERGPRGERGEHGARGERGERGPRGESGSGAHAILPFASGRPIELTTQCGETRGHGAFLGFGNSATTPMPLGGVIDISGGPGLNLDYAFCVPHSCHVTSMSAYFSTVLPVDARCGVQIYAQLYHSDGHDNIFKPLDGARLELEPRLCDRNCKVGVRAHATRRDMSVRLKEGSRVMMVFYAKSKEVHTVIGYASAGIVIE